MIRYSEFTLPNGLRVVHHFDPTPAHVALNVLYNVGARDEDPDLTGMAHLFEHLMFGGSRHIPDFDAVIEAAGGSDNAWTSNDFTNFYVVIPPENLETAFWAESDRMLALSFTPETLEIQRSVVIEEFRQVCLHKPYGDVGHLLRPLLYTTHPYRYPTIGRHPYDLQNITLDHMRQFFYSHYAPNNAVLAVAGPVQEQRVKELAFKWFAGIPSRQIAPRLYAPEPPLTAPRRLEVRRPVPQTRIIIAFPMDPYGTHDYRVADIITDILASGHSARFNRQLVLGTDLFTAADASVSGSEEPGFLMVSANLRGNSDADINAAEKAIWQQLTLLTTQPVQTHELSRALNRFVSNRTFANINYLAKARELALAVMRGEDINTLTDLYMSITPNDIMRVAGHILRPEHSATLIYRPLD